MLEKLGVPAFKTPSGITNLPYLEHIAAKNKPMIVSTGMAYLGEVETAVRTIEGAGNHTIVLLQCVSNYPANPADINLRGMHTMNKAFGVPIGYSDHTLGVSLAAVALACVLLKSTLHLTAIYRGLITRHRRSQQKLPHWCVGFRMVEAALGDGIKRPAASEANTAAVAGRKSLVAIRN